MVTVTLRGGVEIDDPVEVAFELLRGPSAYDAADPSPASFGEGDLRRANRGGARISAAQIAAILERRTRIERALRPIPPEASLTAGSVPWLALQELFEAFADISGVGLSKATKTLHPKRPALVPILDSVVEAYLRTVDPGTPATGTFGERATALVRSFKPDLDRNVTALRGIRLELERRGHRLTEVRILDLLVWSAFAEV